MSRLIVVVSDASALDFSRVHRCPVATPLLPPSHVAAAPAQPPPPLPPGWAEGRDPSTGAAYFFNAARGVTQWTRPLPPPPPPQAARSAVLPPPAAPPPELARAAVASAAGMLPRTVAVAPAASMEPAAAAAHQQALQVRIAI